MIGLLLTPLPIHQDHVASRWQTETKDRLVRAGVLDDNVCTQFEAGRTALTAAVMVNGARGTFVGRLRERSRLLKVLRQTADPTKTTLAYRSLRTLDQKLAVTRAHMPALRRLASELKPQMKALGIDEKEIATHLLFGEFALSSLRTPTLAEVRRPYRDVPSEHWAADAVRTLRNRGIIVGYPQDRFQMPRSNDGAR